MIEVAHLMGVGRIIECGEDIARDGGGERLIMYNVQRCISSVV